MAAFPVVLIAAPVCAIELFAVTSKQILKIINIKIPKNCVFLVVMIILGLSGLFIIRLRDLLNFF